MDRQPRTVVSLHDVYFMPFKASYVTWPLQSSLYLVVDADHVSSEVHESGGALESTEELNA